MHPNMKLSRLDWLCLPLAIFLAVAFGSAVLSHRPAAAEPATPFVLDSARQASMPVTYWVDSRFSAEEIRAIRSAFSAWEEASGRRVSFAYLGTRDARAGAENDGQTTVVRSERPVRATSDAVAQVVRTYEKSEPGAVRRYRDTDIVLDFSGRVAWSSNDATGTQDLQSVIVHEVGHVLGLEHVGDPNQAMYRYIERGARWRRQPAEGDLEGILAGYADNPVRPRPFGGPQLLR